MKGPSSVSPSFGGYLCTTTKLEFCVKTNFVEGRALVCNKVKLQTSSHPKKKQIDNKKERKNNGSVKGSFHLSGMNKGNVSKINARDLPKKRVKEKKQ